MATVHKTHAKGATAATKAKNAAVRRELPFDNTEDFEDARKGLIAPSRTVGGSSGQVEGLLFSI